MSAIICSQLCGRTAYHRFNEEIKQSKQRGKMEDGFEFTQKGGCAVAFLVIPGTYLPCIRANNVLRIRRI